MSGLTCSFGSQYKFPLFITLSVFKTSLGLATSSKPKALARAKEVDSTEDSLIEISSETGLLLTRVGASVRLVESVVGKSIPKAVLSDTEKEVIKAYDVWGPKKFMGKEYDGIHRTTFVIDENGLIERIFTKVKTKEHTTQILETYK